MLTGWLRRSMMKVPPWAAETSRKNLIVLRLAMKLRLVPLSILSLLAISLSCLAQTELVTVVSSKLVSQTAPAPDCSGLTGFHAGVCAAQRQSAQTPTSRTYYTVESERNTYVLV